MTVVNRSYLMAAAPIVVMAPCKIAGPGGTTYGLGEAGYDIRIKQTIRFWKESEVRKIRVDVWNELGHLDSEDEIVGRFALASAIEEFCMPPDLMGIVHDKSTWARRGLSVFNTVIEPGWNGFLTLELVYHGEGELVIPAGAGIAQVIFHEVEERAHYNGKYQNQADKPVSAIDSE